MGYQEITLRLPTDYSPEQLTAAAAAAAGVGDFSLHIVRQSLEARKKSAIHWVVRVGVSSPDLPGPEPPPRPALDIPRRRRREQAVVVGSGPAGFFAALVLQQAGFTTTIIERGAEVHQREAGIRAFEQHGVFDPRGNYAFGEGGAGTFSDGKLTSRSKHISRERAFVLESYIRAGAPAEIRYLSHPHLGSDNLKRIVTGLRAEFIGIGGTVRFETMLTDLQVEKGRVTAAIIEHDGRQEAIEADWYVLAPGHSAHETSRMLMDRGVVFRPKNFAIGCRVEHPQAVINRAQWGREELPGVKAAEYRLTAKGDNRLPVYTFCMCPGGMVVPAAAYADTNIVNGMSRYHRDGHFANAACVAGVDPARLPLPGRDVGAREALAWLAALERTFYDYSGGYRAPCCRINDFIRGTKDPASVAGMRTSYPPGLVTAPLWELLPAAVSTALRTGLREFCRLIKGFETGLIMGLESKTSAPIQVLREEDGRCRGFANLYLAGEGSGYAGGIISSAAGGIRAALHIAGAG
ncbi:MAG: FAD-dependent monooxygenase [Deltaproteobacteria bacterium]|nr:FAD-dependent monooxygenase [Candidatus Anaeroferrophillacea bacterium]